MKSLNQQLRDAGWKGRWNPRLEEIIEACGLKTFRLESWKEGWKAGCYKRVSMKRYALGKTPEEAVKKLWLKLNK